MIKQRHHQYANQRAYNVVGNHSVFVAAIMVGELGWNRQSLPLAKARSSLPQPSGSNLEGGLVKEILVREGQRVQKGQQLLLIDDTRFRSDCEREQQVANLTATYCFQPSISVIDEDFLSVEVRVESVLLDYGKLALQKSLLAQPKPKLATPESRIPSRPEITLKTNFLFLINRLKLWKQQRPNWD